MVLLFNIYLTNTPGNSQTNLFDRGTLPSHSKLDVTKYSLASLAVAYPWTRAIINIELDPVYYSIEDQKNLEDYVNNTFTSTEVLFSSKRSTLGAIAYLKIPRSLVLIRSGGMNALRFDSLLKIPFPL